MAELHSIVEAIGNRFQRTSGAPLFFRGVLRAPPPPGVEAVFQPRHLLVVPANVGSLTRSVIRHMDTGSEFLAGDWSVDAAFSQVINRTYALFGVTTYAPWLRKGFAVEPISGEQRVVGETTLGTIPVMMEPLTQKSDPVDFQTTTYRIFTTATLMLDDVVAGKLIRRVESILGLTYAEAS